LTSILANIARKVDRIEQYKLTSAKLEGESILDTAVDLFVYSAKYVLFLSEQPDSPNFLQLPAGSPRPLSDHTTNFDWQVDNMTTASDENGEIAEISSKIILQFEELHSAASVPNARLDDRVKLALQLRDMAFTLAFGIYKLRPYLIDSVR